MGQINLVSLKTNVQSLLETANTTTASPIDLSNGMTNRVRQVTQINLERMPVQPSFFPLVSMFYTKKDIILQDVSASMVLGRRKADVDLKIIGVVWIDDMNTANFQYKDLASNECERLMENIEEVLRNDPTLGGNALYSKTIDCEYSTFVFQEGALMRAGVLTHRISVFY